MNERYIEAFCYYIDTRNYSDETIKKYRETANNFDKFLSKDFSEITENDIIHYISFLKTDKKLCPTTINTRLSGLKSIFHYLHKSMAIPENPFKNIEHMKTEKKVIRVLTETQQQSLIMAARNMSRKHKARNYMIVKIFLNCGIRLSEMEGLKIKNINLDESSLIVKGKGNKERKLFFNDCTKQAIIDYIENERPVTDSEYLIISSRGKSLDKRTIEYVVSQALLKSGLAGEGFTVHSLRHTCATMMMKNNVNPAIIQTVLGHNSLNTTQLYVHVDNNDIKEVMTYERPENSSNQEG